MPEKKLNLISESNELVRSLMNSGVMKSPVVSTQIRGNFTLAQTKIMVGIVEQLQERIKSNIELHTTKGFSNDLVALSEAEEGEVSFMIPFSSIGIRPDEYRELEEACHTLLHLDMVFPEMNEDTGQEDLVMRNIFTEIRVPKSDEDGGKGRRKGYVQVSMTPKSVNTVFGMRKGYTEHLRGITAKCRSPRTPRLYTFLSSWKGRGFYVAKYNDLKEFLGVTTYNKTRTRIETDLYKTYSEFHRAVLAPAQKELKKLADKGEVEFYFTYEPVYPGTKKRGEPKEVKFNILVTDLGKAMQTEKDYKMVRALMIDKFHIQEQQWNEMEPHMRGIDVKRIKDEIKEVEKLVEKRQPDNVSAYATVMMLSWLAKEKPDVKVFDEAEEVKPVDLGLSDEERKHWEEFCKRLPGCVGQHFCDIYLSCCKLDKIEDDTVFIMAPNSFVVEQWQPMYGKIGPAFMVFGKKKLAFTLDPDYH